MSTDDKSLTRFPSPPPAVDAPPSQQPRGFHDLFQQPRGETVTELATTPGTEDARRDAERRAQLLATIRAQEFALPAIAVEHTLWGALFGVGSRFLAAYLMGRRS